MSRLIGQTFLVIIIFCMAFITIACGDKDSDKDIAPVEAIEIQAMPEALPTTTPAPSPTRLPVEIMESISPVSPASPVVNPTMAPISSDVELIPGSEEALAAAIADLSEQTGLLASNIRLASIEAVDWSDASLGCPQEGFMYAQVITPGYLITLEAQKQLYKYHTNQAANVVLCRF